MTTVAARARAFATCGLLVAGVLPAQSLEDRARLDSLFLHLAGSTAISPPTEYRCSGDGSLQRLCNALIATRRAELLGDPSEATTARDELERVVGERSEWPVAWYGLGIARLQVARTGGLARSGALHPEGVSNEAGAGYALVRALELDTTFVLAAEALAMASLPREGASRIGERLAMLERVEYLLTPPARYQAGVVAVTARNGKAAVRFLRPIQGTPSRPSGLVALVLARAHYQAGDPVAGRAALLAGAADSSSPARAAYRRELAWVASPEELAAWDSLPPGRGPEWLSSFWARRDVRDGRPDGARLVEHYARVEYAFEVFQRIVPQAGVQKNAGMSFAMDYALDDAALRNAVLSQGREDALSIATQRMGSDALIMGPDSPFRAFRTSQTLIDDRGVIWIRHGKPSKIAATSDGVAMAVWRYDRPEGALVLQFREENFDGQAGASVLVPTLMTANPLQRDQLCGVEPLLCSLNADPRGGTGFSYPDSTNTRLGEDAKFTTTAKIQRHHRIGSEAITEATTTDEFARTFPRALAPIVQIYGLDRAIGGAGRAVVAFAVPGGQLTYSTPPEAGGRMVYPLRLEVHLARREDGARFDLDTLRRFATATPLIDGEYLSGIAEVALPGGRYAATVVITQGELGSMARIGELQVPGVPDGLTLSDVVIGHDGSGVRWHSGAMMVPLNPLNSFRRGVAVELYYQLAGLRGGTRYTNQVEFFAADEEARKPPKLGIEFETTATSGRAEVSRSLDLRNLSPGRYRVRITVRGSGETASTVAWLNVVK